jgi:aminopeptidase N
VTPLSYYVPKSDAQYALKGFSPASPSLKVFTETIAPYPYEKLSLIVGATQFGGMENSSAIVFASNLFTPNPSARTSQSFGIASNTVQLIAHEIAHQWFGDSVTESTWADLWLSEGFATYLAGVFVQRTDGETAFRAYMTGAADTYFRYEKRSRVPIHDTETEDLFKLLNANNYQKGAWVLHMLRSQLGDEAFFNGIRDYYNAHKHSIASSEDLRRALEKTSGQNLQQFFASWIYGTGHPEYAVSWRWNSDKKLLTIKVDQTQPEGVFPNWIPVEIALTGGNKRIIIKPNAKDHTEEVALDQAPTSVDIDPDNTILKQVKAKAATATP